MESKNYEIVAKELNITVSQVEIGLNYFKEGATVPFIARYRQSQTNNLNEEQIYAIQSLYLYASELSKRKEKIIEKLKELNLLNNDLEQKINSCTKKSELESIYEPYKSGKITKAKMAIELGLMPLALKIWNNKNSRFDLNFEARKFLSDKLKILDEVILNVNYILSQKISEDFDLREKLKENILAYGKLICKKTKEQDENDKFKNYYQYSTPIKYVKNHNIMAINRGSNLKKIKWDVDLNFEILERISLRKITKFKFNEALLKDAVNDALKRLILPSLKNKIFSDLFDEAEKKSIEIFSNNVETLLSAPAVSGHNILAIDPGYVSGCKLAALSEKGNVLEIATIYPNEPRSNVSQAKTKVLELIKKHNITIIVIGNGTASRETEQFINNLIQENNLDNIYFCIVSEAGASVYSASEIAIEEFPNLSVEKRSAINIGRKFLDPLNELVKIDPKSIGVGQYQHDVNQKELQNYLNFKVQKVVNNYGVDLNSASREILSYISGLDKKTSQNIINYRNKNKSFKSRDEVLKVDGIGPKTFEQSIGFLRVFNSSNFLDKTAIHPESYSLANKIISEYKLIPSEEGIKNLELNAKELSEKYSSSIEEINLILSSLKNPTKIIRSSKQGYLLKKNLINLENLKIGDIVDATINNITDFGLFCYIGLKESLFVHISNLAKKGNIYESYSLNNLIKVKITEINKENKKISGKEI